MIKKLLKYAVGLSAIFLGAATLVFAGQITVPSAPGLGYTLVSTSTGAYQATTTDPLHVGAIFATSTTATSFINGNLTVNGTSTLATTTTTLWDKGGAVFNVKAYGAKGDGVTDDTNAIQNTINLAIIFGGIVQFPSGVFMAGPIYWNGNNTNTNVHIIIQGAGEGATIIKKLPNSANSTSNVMLTAKPCQVLGPNCFLGPASGNEISTAVIRDITLDYDGSNQTYSGVVGGVSGYVGYASTLIQNVEIKNVRTPVYSLGGLSYGLASNNGGERNYTLLNNYIHNNDIDEWVTGFYAGVLPDFQEWIYYKSLFNTLSSSTGPGIYYEFGTGVQLSGDTISSTTQGIYGLPLDNGLETHALISQEHISTTTSYGIVMNGSVLTISQNDTNYTTKNGIWVQGNYGVNVSQNTTCHVMGDGTSIYEGGIYVNSSYANVSNNTTCYTARQGIILDTSSSTVNANTILYPSQLSDDTYAGITATGNGNEISLNSITGSTTTLRMSYGISASATNYLFGNIITNAVISNVTGGASENGLQGNLYISGKLGIGFAPTDLLDAKGSVATFSIENSGQAFFVNNDFFIKTIGTHYIYFSPNNIAQEAISPTGLFGVGTTSPFTNLSVQGNAYISGNITIANIIATSTLQVTASTTLGTTLNGAALTNCSSASNALTWSGGIFGCNTILSGNIFPFTPGTNFGAAENATSTPIFFTNGLQASSTSHFAAFDFAIATGSNLTLTGSSTINTLNISNPLSTAFGGTGTTTGGVTNGIEYYDGTKITNGGRLTYTGSALAFIGSVATFNIESSGQAISTNNDFFIKATGANNIFLQTNSNTALSINSSQKVGIGQTSPGSLLSVNAGGSFGAAWSTLAAPTNGLMVYGNSGIGSTTPFAKLGINALSTDTNTTLFAIGSSTATATTTLLVVKNTGNVGIGTTSPSTILVTVAASTTAGTVQNAYNGVVSIIAGLENTVTMLFQEIDQWGHLITSGDTPVLSACGTSTVSGNDRNGTITLTGVALTSCTMTFAHAYPTAPECTVSDNTTASTADVDTTASAATFGLSVGLNSGKLFYICQDHQ